jgi:putative nucleotidyltransferase with HDIG domain
VTTRLKVLTASTIAAAGILLAAAILFAQVQPAIAGVPGIVFWTVLALVASALPVRLPAGTTVSVGFAPVLTSIVLGGPAAGGIVALLGTFDAREVRREIPWYGTLANHAQIVIPAVVAGFLYQGLLTAQPPAPSLSSGLVQFAALVAAGTTQFAINTVLAVLVVSARSGRSVRNVLAQDVRGVAANLIALVPLAWLMAEIFQLPNGVGWWATPLFVVPLFTTRLAYHRYVETRELFEQTIGALAKAVDARDRYTRGHSGRVSTIAEAMCRVMRLQEAEIEVIKWAGLLHDVGKIGVRDNVLLKEGPLDREERILMNQHPVIGAEIVQPASQLAPESPLIRAHHEWFNGSGYPDGLEALDIPLGARILGVADSYEAMTSARPYRKVPLTHEQAIGELRKYSGIQFDPEIVPVLIGLDRETLDRRSDREDELPTMLNQSDPRDMPPGDNDSRGGGAASDGDRKGPGRTEKPASLPAPRAAIMGQADFGQAGPRTEPRTERRSEPRKKQSSRPALADDVS